MLDTLSFFQLIFLIKYSVSCLHALVFIVNYSLNYNSLFPHAINRVFKIVIECKHLQFRTSNWISFTCKASFYTKLRMLCNFLISYFHMSYRFRDTTVLESYLRIHSDFTIPKHMFMTTAVVILKLLFVFRILLSIMHMYDI